MVNTCDEIESKLESTSKEPSMKLSREAALRNVLIEGKQKSPFPGLIQVAISEGNQASLRPAM
jgi:hypothetical protein